MGKMTLSKEAKRHEPLTRIDEFRVLLGQLEARIGLLGRGLGSEALQILAWLDQITETMTYLQDKGGDFSAEAVRLKTIYAQFERKARLFMREIGGARALKQARAAVNPDPERWWWFVDRVAAEQRNAQLRNLARSVGIGVVLLVIAVVVYRLFFAPSPAMQARLDHLQAADDRTYAGDYAGALAEINLALPYAPNDLELLTYKGALEETLGQETAAAETLAAAEAAASDRGAYLLALAQMYLRVNQPAQSIATVDRLLQFDPHSAAAYYVRGVANESLGNDGAALADYDQAISLAAETQQVELEAMARVQQSNLMMRSFSAGPSPTPPN